MGCDRACEDGSEVRTRDILQYEYCSHFLYLATVVFNVADYVTSVALRNKKVCGTLHSNKCTKGGPKIYGTHKRTVGNSGGRIPSA